MKLRASNSLQHCSLEKNMLPFM